MNDEPRLIVILTDVRDERVAATIHSNGLTLLQFVAALRKLADQFEANARKNLR